MKKNHLMTVLSLALMLALLLTVAGGCGRKDAEQTAEPAPTSEAAEPSASAEPEQTPAPDAREDGERFEAVITIEGMEETVRYEHIKNEAAGVEMDYDYENFERHSDGGVERFVSVYDDPNAPENYLEVSFNARDAESAAAAIEQALSAEYTVARETVTLDGAGSCIHLDASETREGGTMPEQLQAVYVIPAAEGCRIASAHYAIEASEGFGVRFRGMLQTLAVLDGEAGRHLSNEQALGAVKRYCYAQNPDLAGIVKAGEYPVGWDVELGDDPDIVVLFRSYTGAELRYHIDPATGETSVTEKVPAVSPEEQPSDEHFNAWDYAF